MTPLILLVFPASYFVAWGIVTTLTEKDWAGETNRLKETVLGALLHIKWLGIFLTISMVLFVPSSILIGETLAHGCKGGNGGFECLGIMFYGMAFSLFIAAPATLYLAYRGMAKENEKLRQKYGFAFTAAAAASFAVLILIN